MSKSKIQIKKYLDWLKEYLLNTLFMPWVWVWGYLVIYTVFLIIDFRGQKIDVFDPVVLSNDYVSLFEMWIYTLACVFINYTIAFVLQDKYPKLNSLLFVCSLALLSSALVIYFPLLIDKI